MQQFVQERMMTKMISKPENLIAAHEKRMVTTEPNVGSVKFVHAQQVQVVTREKKMLHLAMPLLHQDSF